mmetsp:Transcript_25458/g.82031  ORF Transcript_25458/g.82031 Transcript_25458/m.82031 type:complete len:227 (+) Transcript_25458:1489-2169(+)
MATSELVRADKRQANQLRAFTLDFAPLTRVQGSARFAIGETCVICGVDGPRKPRTQRRDVVDMCAVEVRVKQEREKEPFSSSIALAVKEVAESIVLRTAYPGTELRLQLQVLRDDGALLACCITAATAALLDAGVQMCALASSVACVLDSRSRLLVDPTSEEELAARAVLTLGFTSKDPGIQLCVTSGKLSEEELTHCVRLASSACGSLFAFIRMSLEQRHVGFEA